MAKKKHRHYMQRRQPPQKQHEPDMHPEGPADRRALEKTIYDLTRLIQNQEFESPEAINAYMQGIMASGGQVPSSPAETPLEEAQAIMYDAWDASGAKRIRLARRALSVSPDCADAYVLLAEETARSLEQARDLYEQGVAAGERALGPDGFEEYAGNFWGAIETRPYMRARAGVAMVLMQMGEHQQAIEHYQDMLRLNPDDNQGIRYILAPLYLQVGADDALKTLLDAYSGDISAVWLYARALWMFQKQGANKRATAQLKTAIRQNPFVPAYLLGTKRLPGHQPPYVGRGDDNEAVDYAMLWKHLWTDNPDALAWLRETEAIS